MSWVLVSHIFPDCEPKGKRFVTTADKADRQGGIRAPGLGRDIIWVVTACGTHYGRPVPLLTQGLAQVFQQLGSCDGAGAQDSSPHPCHVGGTDWMCSESLGTKRWDISFSKGGREFVCRVRTGFEYNVLVQGKADGFINRNCKE